MSSTVSETMVPFRVSEPMVPMTFGVLETMVPMIFRVSNTMDAATPWRSWLRYFSTSRGSDSRWCYWNVSLT